MDVHYLQSYPRDGHWVSTESESSGSPTQTAIFWHFSVPLPKTTMAEIIFANTSCSDHERTTFFILPMWSLCYLRISRTMVSDADRPSLLLCLAAASSLKRAVHGNTRENSSANNSSGRSTRTSSHLSPSMLITSSHPCQQVTWSTFSLSSSA